MDDFLLLMTVDFLLRGRFKRTMGLWANTKANTGTSEKMGGIQVSVFIGFRFLLGFVLY